MKSVDAEDSVAAKRGILFLDTNMLASIQLCQARKTCLRNVLEER